MRKEFNITGLCVPGKHYMVDLGSRLEQMKKMVDQGQYFTINRARQYGKTTTLAALAEYLKKEYIVVFLDFQMIGSAMYDREDSFARAFAACFLDEFRSECETMSGREDRAWSETGRDLSGSADVVGESETNALDRVVEALEKSLANREEPFYLLQLFKGLTAVCRAVGRPVVLMADEVDSAADNQVFLDFLSQLRKYYLERARKGTVTFHCVILASVYDVKNLKRKLRPGEEHQRNSPWNIAVDLTLDMSFSKNDIAGMLREYETDVHTGMDIDGMAGLLAEETSGYPFLVCRLCRIMDMELPGTERFPDRHAAWSRAGFLEAVRILVSEKNTLFDSLNHKLEDYPELERVICRLLFNGERIVYNPDVEEIETAMLFGFVKREGAAVAIANRIFETRLYDRFLTSSEWKENSLTQASFSDINGFVVDGHLNMRRILEKFTQHFQELYGEEDERFVEEYGRRFFLLYLRPIINGTGNFYIETQTRDRKRTDVIVDYHGEQFVIEMKIWHGKEYHERGEQQLIGYLQNYRKTTGYLLSFNFNQKKETGVFERVIGEYRIVEAVV